jgi:hypothetical protein
MENLKSRLKSLLWRAAGMTVVALGAYVLQIGDIFTLDAKVLINLAVMTFIGLVVSEITKYLNK